MVLGQFDLGLGVCRLGTVGKDIENERRSVEDFHAELALDVEHLLAGEVVVENRHVYVAALLDVVLDFFEFAFTHKCSRIGVVETLGKGTNSLGTGGVGKKGKFGEVFCRLYLVLLRCHKANEYGFFRFRSLRYLCCLFHLV